MLYEVDNTDNSEVLVRERTTPKLVPTSTDRGVSRRHRDGSLRLSSLFSRLEQLRFISSSSSVVHMRVSGPRSRPATSQKTL
jgi:hypothetical protein